MNNRKSNKKGGNSLLQSYSCNDLNTINMTCMTFNMGSKKLGNIDMNMNALLSKWNFELGTLPEIIVVSLQESKSTEILDFFSKSGYKSLNTDKLEQGALGFGLGYIYLCVFVKNCIFDYNNQIRIELTERKIDYKCELAKGSIGRVLVVDNLINSNRYIFTLISSHLPSDPSKINERNSCMLKSIYIDGDFRYTRSTFSNENLIFMGDLNYRTDDDNTNFKEKNKDFASVISNLTCDTKNLEYNKSCLIKNTSNKKVGCFEEDQLTKELKNLRMKEENINFCPTCRLIEKDDNNNIRNYHGKRVPAWCDRILTNETFNSNVIKGTYSAFNISNLSDHLTVYQHFKINLNVHP